MNWKFWKSRAQEKPRELKLADAVWYEGALYRVIDIRKDGVIVFATEVPYGKRYIQKRVKMSVGELVFDVQRNFWLAFNRPGRLYRGEGTLDGELRN